MSIELTSTAFQPGTTIPTQYTGDGADQSPPLHWSEPPDGTQSLALLCDDPDAPRGTWVHWVLFDLPPTSTGLPAGVPTSEKPPVGGGQGKNDHAHIGWGGPQPPRGHGVHHYGFRLYALDKTLNLAPAATLAQVEAA